MTVNHVIEKFKTICSSLHKLRTNQRRQWWNKYYENVARFMYLFIEQITSKTKISILFPKARIQSHSHFLNYIH